MRYASYNIRLLYQSNQTSIDNWNRKRESVYAESTKCATTSHDQWPSFGEVMAMAMFNLGLQSVNLESELKNINDKRWDATAMSTNVRLQCAWFRTKFGDSSNAVASRIYFDNYSQWPLTTRMIFVYYNDYGTGCNFAFPLRPLLLFL